MNKNFYKLRKSANFLAVVGGSLLMSLPAFAQTPGMQQRMQQPTSAPSSQVNPCPSIFYEPEHTNRVLTPAGCPPNALTQQMQSQGMAPYSSVVPTTPSQEQIRMGVGGEASTMQQGMQQPNPAPSSQVNPCPSIFYEPQHTNRVLVPASCPPNALTQQMQSQGMVPVQPQTRMGGTMQQGMQQSVPATPSQQQTRMGVGTETPSTTTNLGVGQGPIARVTPIAGNVSIRLVNSTRANVIYQVIGDTNQRSLGGNTDIVLRDLQAPVTITFQRDDGGLVSATPQPSSETGMLEVRLNEATDLAQDTKAMRIDATGAVSFN
jgi:hypothetical protein